MSNAEKFFRKLREDSDPGDMLRLLRKAQINAQAEKEVLDGEPGWNVGDYEIVSSETVSKFRDERFTKTVARIRCADHSVREFTGDIEMVAAEARKEINAALAVPKPAAVLEAEERVKSRLYASLEAGSFPRTMQIIREERALLSQSEARVAIVAEFGEKEAAYLDSDKNSDYRAALEILRQKRMGLIDADGNYVPEDQAIKMCLEGTVPRDDLVDLYGDEAGAKLDSRAKEGIDTL